MIGTDVRVYVYLLFCAAAGRWWRGMKLDAESTGKAELQKPVLRPGLTPTSRGTC